MDESNPNLDLFRACIPYFEVLADPTRQQLVLAMGEQHRSLNVGALTDRVSLSRPAVSHHLKILHQAGMVGAVKKGTENYYYLTLDAMVRDLKRFVLTVELTCPRRDL
jgi:DNA-binding transcriptional ArsR family regulator